MTRHLVTGGAGFIGSALVHRLVAEGHRVRVLDDGSRGHASRLDDLRSRVELLRGDIRDERAVDEACEGVEVVWHLAAVNGTTFFYSHPELVLDVGVRGIVNVIAAAQRRGIRELFVASSSEVYQTPPRIPTDESAPLVVPDPLNPRYSYGGAKIISELLALNAGRSGISRVVVFRPHNVYGPDMGWEHVIPQLTLQALEAARATAGELELRVQGSGDETRAFCYVDDLIEGLLVLLERAEPRTIYHVGTDTETPIVELASGIAACLGRTAHVVPGVAPAGSTLRRCPDIGRIRGLGFSPRVALSDGLATTVAWYAAHAAERPTARAS